MKPPADENKRRGEKTASFYLILLLVMLAFAMAACGSMNLFSRDERTAPAPDDSAPFEKTEVLGAVDEKMKGDLFICEFEPEGVNSGDLLRLLNEAKVHMKNVLVMNLERRSRRFWVKRCTNYHRRLNGLALRGRYVSVVNQAGRYQSAMGLASYTVRVSAELMLPRSDEVIARFTMQAGPGGGFGDVSLHRANQEIADRLSELIFRVLEPPPS